MDLSRRNAIYIIATISTGRLRAEILRQIRRLDVKIYFCLYLHMARCSLTHAIAISSLHKSWSRIRAGVY